VWKPGPTCLQSCASNARKWIISTLLPADNWVLNNLRVHADAFAVMVSRICGILGGCLISLFLSVLVFPTSASQKATDGLSEGLEALTSLSQMAWGQEGKSAQAFSANSRLCFSHHSFLAS